MIKKITILTFLLIFTVFSVAATVADPNSPPASGEAIDSDNQTDSDKTETADENPPKPNPFNKMCEGVLNSEFISDSGNVDYEYLRRSRSQLYEITRKFKTIEVDDYLSWELEEQVAFWINAHNICTLELIINNYPIKASRFRMIFYPSKSIMQISGARNNNYFEIMGREYSLEEMEKFALELYGDPRVLFGINYGALGSPPLRNEPYLAHQLEKQLDNQARRFLGRKNGFYIDSAQLYISPIFEWNIDSFVEYYGTDIRYRAHPKQTRAIFNFIEEYKGLGWSRILESDKFRLRYQKFDWRLNGN